MAAEEQKHTNRHKTESTPTTAADEDLDEYGVWVKAGPEDVSDEAGIEDDSEAIFDLQQDDTLKSDELQSSERYSEASERYSEEVESPSEESEFSPETTSGDDTAQYMSDFGDDMDLTDEEEALLADLDDFDEDVQTPESPHESAGAEDEQTREQAAGIGQSEAGGGDEDVELPDLDFPEADDLDMDLPQESDESQEAGESEEFGFGDLEMPFDSDEAKAGDSESDIEFEYAESNEELADLEFGDDEDLAIHELSSSSNGGKSTDQVAAEPAQFDTPPAEEIESSQERGNAEGSPVTEISLEQVDDDFDDVSAVAGEMSQPVSETGEASRQEETRGYSPQAFERIQSELSSIKSELAELKQELHDLRGIGHSVSARQSPQTEEGASGDVSQAHAESQPGSRSAGAMEEDSRAQEAQPFEIDTEDEDASIQLGDGGFFEEDEDETIALTGDELDNILNTAEFTQKQGQPTNFEDSELDLDLSSLQQEEGPEDLVEEAEEIPDEQEEHFAFDQPDSTATAEAEVEELTESGVSQEQPETEQSKGEPFGASHEEVDALANMDIDSELADIDELEDTESMEPMPSDSARSSEPEVSEPSESDLEESAEAESIELETDTEEPETAETAETAGMDLDFETGEERSVDHGEPVQSEGTNEFEQLPENLREEIRSVLSYMDQLLESLPEEKIREFANSEHFEVYKRLFEELDLEP